MSEDRTAMADEVGAACRLDASLTVRAVRRLGSGDTSEVFQVQTDGGVLAVKVYAAEHGWKQDKERFVYELLRPRLGNLVPQVLAVHNSSSSLGRPYTVMTRLPGQPVSEVMGALDPEATRAVYRAIGELAAKIHSIAQDAFGYLTTSIVDPRPDNVEYMTAQLTGEVSRYSSVAPNAGDLSQRVEALLASLGGCVGAALCHNDLHEANVLVSATAGHWRVTGLVDVENAVAGDPLLDVAKLDVYSIRGDRDKATGFATGYGLHLDESSRARLHLYRIFHVVQLRNWFQQIDRHDAVPGLDRQLEQLLHVDV